MNSLPQVQQNPVEIAPQSQNPVEIAQILPVMQAESLNISDVSERECKICYDQIAGKKCFNLDQKITVNLDHLFLPCRHIVCCQVCVQSFPAGKKCPMCTTEIVDRIGPVYFG